MNNPFTQLHVFISKRKYIFAFILIILFAGSIFQLFQIKYVEDIQTIIPKDDRIDEISELFNSSQFADKIIINISLSDTLLVNDERLINTGQKFVDIISKDSNYIKNLQFKINEDNFFKVYDFIYDNIPFYLNDNDYTKIDSLLTDSMIDVKIDNGYRSLFSLMSMATKKYFSKDPLNIVAIAIKKLQNFQLDENFIINNSCVFTKDRKHLLIFIDPVFPASNTKENTKFVAKIREAVAEVKNEYNNVNIEVYGGTVVAVDNSIQIQKDIFLTVSLTVIFLTLLFGFFFRQIKVIPKLFIPAFFGALFSIVILSLIYGQVSLISLGIGAIFMGISVDYSIHFITHNSQRGSVLLTIKEVAFPLIISCLTTATALLCIGVLKSEALKQLGLFAAIGIILVCLFTLIILPFLLKKTAETKKVASVLWFEKMTKKELKNRSFFAILILIISIVFVFSLKNLKFNSDISDLNYQSEEIKKAEKNLKAISSEANSGVFVFTHDKSLNNALLKLENNLDYINSLVKDGYVKSFSSAADLILSKEKQKAKIEKWNKFWSEEKKQNLKFKILQKSSTLKIKKHAFNEFFNLLEKKYEPIEMDSFNIVINSFLSNYINISKNEYYVATILKVNKNKPELIKKLQNHEDLVVFDKQLFITKLLEILKEDFNVLSILSMAVVFFIILLFFGRIEIAFIAALPVFIGWLWTMGLMSVFGIPFNIFNIIISSFVIGLGQDYSVFLVSGLIDKYKYGGNSIVSFKLSVFLSALTTLGAFGVLVFAKHPALKSIAIVSIFGISSVLLITLALIPLLFNTLINTKKGKRSEPINLKNLTISIVSFIVFLLGSIMLTVIVPFLFITPISKRLKKRFMCLLISLFSKFIVNINITIKRKNIDKHKLDFSKPSIIIANHQSHLDLVLMLMLNPKIIVFTNKWVWNNIFYGFVIRYAEYFPAYKGIESDFEKIKRKVSEGYSILLFPEGKRSVDGEINRFHQGAIHLAHELDLEIQPIMIHGTSNSLPKNEFFLKSGFLTIKFFDKIMPKPEETNFGMTFNKQAKEITKFYRDEYKMLKEQCETPEFFKQKLINQYIYKGPVLEWYLKIKIKLEKNYNFYNDIIPRKAKIVDIGCGYGFLSYMLRLISKERTVIGIDYDEEKIKIANNLLIKDEGINFIEMDINEGDIPSADVYVLNDVLHYMSEDMQRDILDKCILGLSSTGIILVRDADADLKRRTKFTKFTEIQSTKIFKFNKTKSGLTYLSGNFIKKIASDNGLICEVYDNAHHTSNITYAIRRPHE